MIVNQNEQRNFQAVSAIELNGQVVPILNMGAQYNAVSKQLNFSETVQNYELYKANKEVADEDYEAFKSHIESEIG